MMMDKTELLGLVADAMREVAAASNRGWEAGRCSAAISRCDLEETLLAVADKLDPPTPKPRKTKPAPKAKQPANGSPGPKAVSDLFKF